MPRGSTRPLIDSESFETLEGPWQALFQATPAATPFCHPAWVRAWMGEDGSSLGSALLAVRREEHLIGVVPLDLGPGSARFLGDPNVFDYAPLLVATGQEEAVARGILEWLGEDMTPEFVVWGLANGPFMDALLGAGDLGWAGLCEAEAVARAVECAGDFDAYVSSLSKKDRHELRRKMRNFEAAGQVAFEVAASGDAFAAALEGLVVLMRASHQGKVDFLQTYEHFFRAGAHALAGAGVARISTLHLERKPVGASLTFEHSGCAYLYNSGFAPDFGHLAAGLVSKAYTIRGAIERGITRFDFLRGDEEYKRRLGGVEAPITTVHLRRAG